jgi:hypothetical protein
MPPLTIQKLFVILLSSLLCFRTSVEKERRMKWKQVSIAQQVQSLQRMLGEEGMGYDLDDSHVKEVARRVQDPIRGTDMQPRVGNLLVFPKLSSLANVPDDEKLPDQLMWPKENYALEAFLGALTWDERYAFANHLQDQSMTPPMSLDPRCVRYREHTVQAYRKLEAETPGDYLIVPYLLDTDVGAPPFRVQERIESMSDVTNPDPVAVLSWMYTHDHVLRDDTLWVDILGIDVAPKSDEKYSDTCYADRRGGPMYTVNLDWNWGRRARPFRLAPSIHIQTV